MPLIPIQAPDLPEPVLLDYAVMAESVSPRINDRTVVECPTALDAIAKMVANMRENRDALPDEQDYVDESALYDREIEVLTSPKGVRSMLLFLERYGAYYITVGDPTYEPIRYAITRSKSND